MRYIGQLRTFFRILRSSADWLDESTCSHLMRTGDCMMQTYAILGQHAYRAGLPRYKMRPKCHMFTHIILDAVALGYNPGRDWTFKDEDHRPRIIPWLQAVLHAARPLAHV